ncbi:outer membrane lipoprotein-sorting protein [Teredinibacter haidensis]|uniref:outer membrane lipoprotein-sorting protein n=1 Tax=Teredinibacter haidensis TaxID=2731755 RepID=UPI000948B8B1|nr:outer membrane lipoprotein-sorting protein [Teredinibacter haidensis]
MFKTLPLLLISISISCMASSSPEITKIGDVKVETETDMTRSEDTSNADRQGSLDVNGIMAKVIDRYVGHTEVSTISLMTCPYRMKNNSLSCSSKPRKKTVKSLTKSYGDNLRDSKGLMLIVSPVAEYGIGVLQYDYTSSGKDADQWLYLPELDQVKRVASSADAPKKGSLFGSEFALEDMEKEKIEEYHYTIIEESEFSGHDAIVIEQKPNLERAKKSNYLKRVKWVDRENYVVLKEDFYELNGELLKTSLSSDIENIEGIWTVKKQTMRNIKTSRISLIQYTGVTYNLDIDDEYLTQRILSDSVFRENFLNSLGDLKVADNMQESSSR